MTERDPFFSIIVPTFNRLEALESCLEALSRLDYPRDRFEVIVVDDGSALWPEKIVAPYGTRMDITLCGDSHAGPAAARNRGALRAKGEFLAFTDDDCSPDGRWLRFFAGRLMADPDSVVGGRTVNALSGNPFSSASQLLIDYLYDYYLSVSAPSFTTNNLALSARTFQDLGGFDTGFPFAAGEDREFCRRARSQGRLFVFCHEAVVYHLHRLTLAAFWRQHFQYGKGAFIYREKSETEKSLEPFMFYVKLVLSPFLRRSPLPVRMFGLLLVSQAANALGFFRQAMVQEPRKSTILL